MCYTYGAESGALGTVSQIRKGDHPFKHFLFDHPIDIRHPNEWIERDLQRLKAHPIGLFTHQLTGEIGHLLCDFDGWAKRKNPQTIVVDI
jgi:hypothetical protein